MLYAEIKQGSLKRQILLDILILIFLSQLADEIIKLCLCRKHQTYESATLAQAANAVAVSKEQDKQPQYIKKLACGDVCLYRCNHLCLCKPSYVCTVYMCVFCRPLVAQKSKEVSVYVFEMIRYIQLLFSMILFLSQFTSSQNQPYLLLPTGKCV